MAQGGCRRAGKRLVGVIFADPAFIFAEQAFHTSVPMRADAKWGRTSAPRLPHAVQINRGSISESRTSSTQPSADIAIEWLQR
jgi:hypothetical protein